MLLNDKTISFGLFEGLKLATHQRDHAISLCRFGQAQNVSLVAIGQNLDKLLIYDLATLRTLLVSGPLTRNQDQLYGHDSLTRQQQRESAVSYISIKDQVIQSVSVIEIRHAREQLCKDLLLICCSNSIMIYDTFNQEHMFSINTSSKITTISTVSPTNEKLFMSAKLLFCGGIQKLYAYQMDCSLSNNFDPGQSQSTPTDKLVSFEMLNERTISETVSCLIHGQFLDLEWLIVGFNEAKIKLYSVDSLDQTIQTCRLTLGESGKINCLCGIETVHAKAHHVSPTNIQHKQQQHSDQKSTLPSIGTHNELNPQVRTESEQVAEMNYFAYGLETGFVGVYRLLATDREDVADAADQDDQDVSHAPKQLQVSIFGERLWRHKSKQTPVSLSLFDIDGDGLDELIIGYRNGRLEARSPFTGQLITSTRCFKSSGHLVGLVKWTLEDSLIKPFETLNSVHETAKIEEEQSKMSQETGQDQILLVSSSFSTLVAFRPQQRQPRQPLTDHLASSVLIQHRKNEELRDFGRFMPAAISAKAVERTVAQSSEDPDSEINELVHDDEDDARSRSWPISCESRQTPELLQEIGLMKKRRADLRQRLRQAHRELLCEQMATSRAALEYISASGAGSEQSGFLRMAHFWNYDGATNQLLLTLVVDSLVDLPLTVEMIEIIDNSKRLVYDGYLLLNPVKMIRHKSSQDQTTVLVDQNQGANPNDDATILLPKTPTFVSVDLTLGSYALEQYHKKASSRTDEDLKPLNQPIELRLDVYLGGDEHQKRARKRSAASATFIRNVHKRTVVLPKFAMFVPESLIDSSQLNPSHRRYEKELMIKKAFVLPERTNKLQILDWLHSNFLCFQFGQIIDQEHQTELCNDHDELWTPARDYRLNAMRLDENMLLNMRKFNPNSTYTKESESQEENDGGFEFVFVDLRTIDQQQEQHLRRLRFKLNTNDRQLILESDDSDLLVELIQLLVVERLQLNIRDHSVKEKEQDGGVEMLLKELSSINENSRQLEESERRIQMEIYESAELIKSLMQQLSIANDLQEFGIARELLAETSMMLNGTHNSAQAHYLNNRSRLNLIKQANCLREKVLFLTGDDEMAA